MTNSSDCSARSVKKYQKKGYYNENQFYAVGRNLRKFRSIIGSLGAISLARINNADAPSNSPCATKETAFPFKGAGSCGDSEIVASQILVATP